MSNQQDPKLNQEQAHSILSTIWNIVSESPATLKEHQKRAVGLEWLKTRIDKLYDLELADSQKQEPVK
jgi:hypothetical protein